MAKKTVNVTMFADPIEVDEAEIPGLRAQGLLVEADPGGQPSGGDGGDAGTGRRPRKQDDE
jgi:hypothetical protein